jgi:hypothetical protein
VELARAESYPRDEPRLLQGRVVDSDGKPVVGASVEPYGLLFTKPKPVPGQRDSFFTGSFGPIEGMEPLAITDEAGDRDGQGRAVLPP